MDYVLIYDELEKVIRELETLTSHQYLMTDIPLERRDELSGRIYEIQKLVLNIKSEVASNIKDEWL